MSMLHKATRDGLSEDSRLTPVIQHSKCKVPYVITKDISLYKSSAFPITVM